MKYFLEFKNRVMLLIFTLLSTLLIGYLYKETFLFMVLKFNVFYSEFNNFTFFYLIFTNVTEVFSIYIRLITFVGVQILLVLSIFHFFNFLSSTFFKSEYLYLKFSLKMILIFWVVSAITIFYIIIPVAFHFFLSFQDLIIDYSITLHFEGKIEEYILFYLDFYFLLEFYLQLFIIFLLIVYYNKINKTLIKKFRKIIYYCFIIFSTLLSPPEIFSQIFLSFIGIIFYETLSFFLIFKNLLPIKSRQSIRKKRI